MKKVAFNRFKWGGNDDYNVYDDTEDDAKVDDDDDCDKDDGYNVANAKGLVLYDAVVVVASLLEEYFLEGLPEVLVEHRVDHLTNKILILAQWTGESVLVHLFLSLSLLLLSA